jgi:hypothetical protein
MHHENDLESLDLFTTLMTTIPGSAQIARIIGDILLIVGHD